MPIVLTPVEPDSVDANIISPNTSYSRMNCPVVMKTRSIIIDRGQQATIEWQIRNRNGQPVDLTGKLGYVKVRFRDTMSCQGEVWSVDATVTDAATGMIQFEIPADVRNRPSIYAMQVGVYSNDDALLFADTGLLSVERGLFDTDPETAGPITLNEIRMQLRDTLVENQLLGQVEFDDSEIIHSIVQPIMFWNEIPPPIGYHTPYTFPYRYHWLRGTVSNLLKISAAWYLRNKMNMNHGGMQEDILDRNSEYMALAIEYDKEWKDFVDAKKVELNIRGAYGTIP